MKDITEKFDVVVIGGGPAGMLAAGRAAELGARVALLERNRSLGNKLLMTGNGRCNLTQGEFNDADFVRKFGDKKAKFLFSALSVFGPEEVINFFEKRGVLMNVEKDGRVFPKTGKAPDVLHVLEKYLQENKVEIIFNADVGSLEMAEGKIASVKLKDKNIHADKFILCTGGKSYPNTGSTGSGYALAKAAGHWINKPQPALVPIEIKESWIKDLQGLSLKTIVSIFQQNKKQETLTGEMLFTHFGLSGPMIINASKKIGELLAGGSVFVDIDLLPEVSTIDLDKKMQQAFIDHGKKDLKNYLAELLPLKLATVLLKLSSIDGKKKLNLVTKVERLALAKLIKNLRLTVKAVQGYNQAMVTSGGVELKEVDSKTMRSKIVSNLFFAGEVLDLDGPTGGYNLQVAWSTGYAAGTHAAGK
ncbi:MAG: NAD(P)/FAD-dependent oxidoreductase [Parcubacteria group bacterium]|jgi:hypothetical protein